MRVMFHGNNFGASSPLRLVDALEERGIFSRVIKHEGSVYQPRQDDLVINWGIAPNRPDWRFKPKTLNPQSLAIKAVDKLDTFKLLKEAGVRTPKFTTDYNEALAWSRENAVVGRSLLRSCEGRGIALTKAGEAPAKADNQGRKVVLWTRYVPKKEEWRVHVFNGKAIDVAQKRRRRDANVNNQVRSWRNGWVFARENLKPPRELKEIGVAAVKALGLTFGAVDVIWQEKSDKCFVLEVNTAPAIEGTTVERYADAIKEYIGH